MDPVLEEFCRAHELQVSAFRRMQRYFRDELGPKLDRLETENAELKAQLASPLIATMVIDSSKVAENVAEIREVPTHVFGGVVEPVKRKRGRPRKHPIVEAVASV